MNIKDTLKKLNQSYASVAAAVGVSPAAISQIANHGLWPKHSAASLRAALQQFFSDSGTAMPDELSVKPHHTADLINESEDDTMLLRKATLTQSARAHFHLPRDPFSDEIASAEDVYLTPDMRYVREAMWMAAAHGDFVAVIGESGSGKSTLREDLHDRICRESRAIIVIEPYVLAMEDNDQKGKTLKAAQIAEAILEAVAPGTAPKRSPEARFRQVHKALQDSAKAGNKHVLVIEEAHGLPLPTLKHLKRFFELKQGFERLLGILLIGQTELAHKLSEHNPHVREVVQRCDLVTLLPLDGGKLRGYLQHKFARAGGDMRRALQDSALEAIEKRLTVHSRSKQGMEQHSLLYPLAVNNLVSAALNRAAELGFDAVDADLVMGV